MATLQLQRANMLQATASILEGLGQPTSGILRRASVRESWVRADPESMMPVEVYYRFLEDAIRTMPEFGGQFARTALSSLGLLGRLIRSAPTVGAAIQTVVDHWRHYGSPHSGWTREDPVLGGLWLCRTGPGPFVGAVALSELIFMQLAIEVVRLGAGAEWRPLEVRLCGPGVTSVGLTDIEALRDVRTKTRQPWGGVHVEQCVLDLPVSREPVPARDSIQRWAAGGPLEPGEFATAVRQLTQALLGVEEALRVETICQELGLSPRSLQRRLAAEGTSFRRVLDDARFQRARRLLTQTDMRLTDIAFELGYADLAQFSHAYRRWAGAPPSEIRRSQEPLPAP